MIRSLFFSLILFCMIPLAGCDSSTKRPDGSASPLVIGVMPSLDYLPLAVAEREGYFEELGLPVAIQLFFSANERDAAFHSHSIDGTVIDYTGAIIQHASGMDLRLTSRCDAPFYLMASSASQARNVTGLQNRTIAISQNTVIDYLVDQALRQAGIPLNQVTRVEINRIPIRYEMLVNNKIDATGLPNPSALLAEKAGAAILASNRDMDLSITGIMFSKPAIDNKKDQIRKMYLAYAKAVTYLKEHPASDIKDILIGRFGFTEDTVNGQGIPEYGMPTLPDEKSITQVTEWLKERQLIRQDYNPYAGFLDGQFLP